jgi:hypothetical protein
MISGLAGIGYVLHQFQGADSASPAESFVGAGQENSGSVPPHGNMVPYYRGSQKGAYGGNMEGNEALMDSYRGMNSSVYQHKSEVSHLGTVAKDVHNPYGMPVRTDFYESRVEAPVRAANVQPFERQYVGRGLGVGPDVKATGGFHQSTSQDYARGSIRTTDELRTLDNPKVSYKTDPVPGAPHVKAPHNVENQAEVPRYRPDAWFPSGPERWMTQPALEKGMRAREDDHDLRDQNRDTTDLHNYQGPAQAAAAGYQSYIRPVLEPFMTFFKLTVGEHFGAATTAGGAGYGASLYDVWNTIRQNLGREEINVSAGERAPNGAGHFSFNGKDEFGQTFVRKDENIYANGLRVTNPARNNTQAVGMEERGVHHYKPKLEEDTTQNTERLSTATKGAATQLQTNPYFVAQNI